jgi:hypothetical protein
MSSTLKARVTVAACKKGLMQIPNLRYMRKCQLPSPQNFAADGHARATRTSATMNATNFIVQNAQELTTILKLGSFQPEREHARLRQQRQSRLRPATPRAGHRLMAVRAWRAAKMINPESVTESRSGICKTNPTQGAVWQCQTDILVQTKRVCLEGGRP